MKSVAAFTFLFGLLFGLSSLIELASAHPVDPKTASKPVASCAAAVTSHFSQDEQGLPLDGAIPKMAAANVLHLAPRIKALSSKNVYDALVFATQDTGYDSRGLFVEIVLDTKAFKETRAQELAAAITQRFKERVAAINKSSLNLNQLFMGYAPAPIEPHFIAVTSLLPIRIRLVAPATEIIRLVEGMQEVTQIFLPRESSLAELPSAPELTERWREARAQVERILEAEINREKVFIDQKSVNETRVRMAQNRLHETFLLFSQQRYENPKLKGGNRLSAHRQAHAGYFEVKRHQRELQQAFQAYESHKRYLQAKIELYSNLLRAVAE